MWGDLFLEGGSFTVEFGESRQVEEYGQTIVRELADWIAQKAQLSKQIEVLDVLDLSDVDNLKRRNKQLVQGGVC